MTGIAFYAPLKSPNHPTPSGDRRIARNLMIALEMALEQRVLLASELRSFEPGGDETRQNELIGQAAAEIQELTGSLGAVTLWVTYHNYYKAPDLIGPAVAQALKIPYVLIEATRARSRLTGPWAGFAACAEAASDAASVIFHFTEQDRIALDRDRKAAQRIVPLPPFLDRSELPSASACDGPMLAAGMMRGGDKLASYALIAEALALVKVPGWQLEIAGDGPARAEVEALFAPFAGHVRFLGALTPEALETAYARASLLLWPGVNEAFGMVYLEAQAVGLPVVAQDRPGVRDVLAPGEYPMPEAGPEGLAGRLNRLLSDPGLRRTAGRRARDHVAAGHLMPVAADTLRRTLAPLIGGAI